MTFQPEAFASAIQEDLRVETDPAHRLWHYDPASGFYRLPETEWAVRRAVATLMVDTDFDSSYKPDSGIPRPAQGNEVLEVLRRRIPRILPGTSEGHLLACGNTSLDLTDPTAPKPTEHSPDHYLTAGIPHPYNPEAEHPTWTNFLNQVLPDLDDQRLLAQFFGASLADRPPPKGVLYLWGPANSGKSAICRIAVHLLGRGNVSVVSPHDLSEQRFAAADLFGKMANIVPDIPTEPIRNTSVYKQVTGGDLIRADIKYASPIHFVSTAATLYSGNDLPKSFNDPSDGFYERQISVHLPTKVTKPDPTLEPRIRAEAEGILRWALVGLHDLYGNGWEYAVPPKVRSRQEADYEAANHEHAWIADRTLEVEGEFLERGEAYTDYEKWAEKQGLKAWGRTRFYSRLRNTWGEDRKTNGKRGWDGYGLLA